MTEPNASAPARRPARGARWWEPRPGRSRGRTGWWERPGLSPSQERLFRTGTSILLILIVGGWSYALALTLIEGEPPPLTGRVTANPFAADAPQELVFLVDAALQPFVERAMGESGEVYIMVPQLGDTIVIPPGLPPDAAVGFTPADAEGGVLPAEVSPEGVVDAPQQPGIWNVVVSARGAIRTVPGVSVLTLVPLTDRRGGRIGSYLIGEWPTERRPRAGFEPPRGLVRVTPENMNMPVSRHFKLGDFLTKGQDNVWPKYVAISPRLLDKLELTIQELERLGHPVENVGVISGFRTPHYNMAGGDPRGRGALSRHMYGDAMDFYIDNNRDGRMDDLNGDGRVDIRDAQIIARAAEAVERRYPHLIGGIGIYRPNPGAHSGFVHLDTRGFRARW
jgi:uncharacterized protein YcbK (DUF882 family)